MGGAAVPPALGVRVGLAVVVRHHRRRRRCERHRREIVTEGIGRGLHERGVEGATDRERPGGAGAGRLRGARSRPRARPGSRPAPPGRGRCRWRSSTPGSRPRRPPPAPASLRAGRPSRPGVASAAAWVRSARTAANRTPSSKGITPDGDERCHLSERVAGERHGHDPVADGLPREERREQHGELRVPRPQELVGVRVEEQSAERLAEGGLGRVRRPLPTPGRCATPRPCPGVWVPCPGNTTAVRTVIGGRRRRRRASWASGGSGSSPSSTCASTSGGQRSVVRRGTRREQEHPDHQQDDSDHHDRDPHVRDPSAGCRAEITAGPGAPGPAAAQSQSRRLNDTYSATTTTSITIVDVRTPQCAGEPGIRDVHAVVAGDERGDRDDRRPTRDLLHDLVLAVVPQAQVRLDDRRHEITQRVGRLDDAEHVVVEVLVVGVERLLRPSPAPAASAR